MNCQSRAGWASDLRYPASFGKAFCPASRKFRSLSQAALQDYVGYPSNKVCFMMNLSMRCGAWRPSCMQAPADLNPYAIAFTSFCQQNSFTWSSGRRLLMLRHCSVSIVEDASPSPSTGVGGALSIGWEWWIMQANQSGSRGAAKAQRSETPGLSKSNVLDAMHLSKEAGVIRKVGS